MYIYMYICIGRPSETETQRRVDTTEAVLQEKRVALLDEQVETPESPINRLISDASTSPLQRVYICTCMYIHVCMYIHIYICLYVYDIYIYIRK